MTSEDSNKRRCVIKKLDFENCIVTGIRTKARGKRKLRARVTHEVENLSSSPEKISTYESPERGSSRETSPVLIKKQDKGNASPVFSPGLKRKQVDLNEVQELPHCFRSTQTSPVFKVKNSKLGNFSQTQFSKLTLERTSSADMFFNDGNSSFSRFRNPGRTQESQESVVSVHISSVESVDAKVKSSGNYSVEVKSDSPPKVSETSGNNSYSDSKQTSSEAKEESDEIWPVLKKNYKKKSLLGRLQKALKRKASEKLLWQHQRQRNIAFNSQKLTVTTFWNQDSNFFLKCRPLGEKPEVTFLVIDSKWVPNVKRVKEGSTVQLHPPWQKLCVAGKDVFLNVICLEVLDEASEPCIQTVTFESVATKPYDTDQSLLIDSLLSTCNSGFLF